MPSAALDRRQFLGAATIATAGLLTGCSSLSSKPFTGVFDTHTHFYDPTRPEGVPWPPKNDALLYRPVYPEEFKRISQAHGVTGTVVVEASSWLNDNQWILSLAAGDEFLLGLVGNVPPGRPEFGLELRRLAANRLFRGVRVHVSESSALGSDPDKIRDLALLAERGLSLDVLTGPAGLEDVARLAAALPSLRIIIDHCANVSVNGEAPPEIWLTGLQRCSRHGNVFMKVSGLVEGTGRTDGTAPADLAHYLPTLQAIWETFGEDRVLFGSNWPVSTRFASYSTVFNIVAEYFHGHGARASEKYFARNAMKAYQVAAR